MLDMNETALLPEGLHDTLANEAEHEALVVEKLRLCFAGYGYERVVPPLVEFEESLLSGPGKAQSRNMFRVMDPVSQRMMAVRNDMTGQVARIARTRLGTMPRPLRLSYSGEVLRVRGTQLRPEREFKQAGVELVGSDSVEAYVEIILLAHDALTSVGVKNLSIDLTMPLLVPAICAGLGLDAERTTFVRHALNVKDMGALKELDGKIGEISRALLAASGSAHKALEMINALPLKDEAAAICAELNHVIGRLNVVAPDLKITIDPGEYSGFEFQSGIGFSLFAEGVRGELGRGGRYLVGQDVKKESEPATGFSLYLDSLMRALSPIAPSKKIYIPFGTDLDELAALRARGFRTVGGLEEIDTLETEAARLGCTYVWMNNEIKEI